ncbi:hypothetical protein QT971_06820 [Microcoleus sp. herbarium19]|uniref:hypothetical protein n=1 Tax=unclassified Microcoleus TaxID=2642155 RepID=UPI002FD72A49
MTQEIELVRREHKQELLRNQKGTIAAQYTSYDGRCSFPDLDCKLILRSPTYLSYVAYGPSHCDRD